jgi:O-antigen/teichoic acid export membrane protein
MLLSFGLGIPPYMPIPFRQVQLRQNMIASVVAGLFNIILNYVFIPRFGYIAAAYTTLFCYGVFTLAHYNFMRIICKKHLACKKIYDTRFIVLVCFGVCFAAAGLMALYRHAIMRYIIAAFSLALCVLKRKRIEKVIAGMKLNTNNAG